MKIERRLVDEHARPASNAGARRPVPIGLGHVGGDMLGDDPVAEAKHVAQGPWDRLVVEVLEHLPHKADIALRKRAPDDVEMAKLDAGVPLPVDR